jgi:putative tryptophan/tyrosine transport system substrate-binding protein
MRRRTLVAVAAGVLLPASPALRAQAQPAPHRIAYLSAFARTDIDVVLGLIRVELDKLGWTDGRNIVLLEPRTSESRNELLPALAAEIVTQGPDLILVQSLPATRALMQATKSIPIVMYAVGNPVEAGIVADYRKPGGNVTGSSYMANEYARKLLQLLKEAAPGLRSVAVFANPGNEAAALFSKLMRADAAASGMQAQIVEVLGPGDFEAAFAAIRSANTQAILLPPESLILSKREAIAGFAQTHRLPLAVVGVGRTLPSSGLMAFGPARDEYPQLAARYVDRILKGARPGDLAVEQTTRFTLVINLKAAKVLGLTIPPSLLLRADEVIE